MTPVWFVPTLGLHRPRQEARMDAASDTAHQPTSGVPAPGGDLSDREREVLAFERQWWKYAGAKEQAVRELFDRPDALAFDPMLVKRLRRMRESRQRARSARRLGLKV